MNKHTWNMIATAGLILGVTVDILMLLTLKASPIFGFINVLAFVGIIWFYTRKYARQSPGVTFGTLFRLIIAMMPFAGIIVGLGYYLCYEVLAPDVYLETVQNMHLSKELEDNMLQPRGILFWVFSGIMGMVIYGGFIGLFIAAMQRRNRTNQPQKIDSNLTDTDQHE